MYGKIRFTQEGFCQVLIVEGTYVDASKFETAKPGCDKKYVRIQHWLWMHFMISLNINLLKMILYLLLYYILIYIKVSQILT